MGLESQGYVGTVAWVGVQDGLDCSTESWDSGRMGGGLCCLGDGGRGEELLQRLGNDRLKLSDGFIGN